MIPDEFHTVEISEQPLEGAPEVGLAPPAEAAAPQSAASKSLLFAVDKLLKSKKSKPDSEEPSSKPSDDSSAQWQWAIGGAIFSEINSTSGRSSCTLLARYETESVQI